ncbi:MAG TPA: hypothetical protein VFG68_09895 [Fimbriiglobus sp.]|nr:hypothetical protein [Fimbriiglobus sp.]
MFEYRWLETTLDELANLYVAADRPEWERMAAGVERLNARLAADPLDVGESRGGGYRVAFLPLLMVSFHVDEVNRIVRVTAVSRYGR